MNKRTLRPRLAALLLPFALVSCFPHAETPSFSAADTVTADTIATAAVAADTAESAAAGPLELPAPADGDRVIAYSGFTLSYDSLTLVPDWVAYELTAEETDGTYSTKSSSFSRDPNLRGRQSSREDYSRSGWDKGHMAPKADLRWSEKSYWESYYFTNVCPQNHRLNCGDWNRLEKAVRQWAKEYGRVWVVCGPLFTTGAYGTIGPNSVHIPDYFFKAVLAPKGEEFVSIAFLFPNDARDYKVKEQAMSVDKLETIIDRDLFPALPDKKEGRTESAFAWSDWPL